MTLFDDPTVAEIIGPDLSRAVANVFRDVEIAEEEIAQARGTTEPDENDPVWQAFKLLRRTNDLMGTEFVYRSHVRELLARVAAGEDTRPATDAEIAVNVSQASQSTPLHGAAVALQMRLFKRAFPEKYALLKFDDELYERMYGRDVDELEREFRRKLRQEWRR